MKPFILGTRGSDLALAQTRMVADLLRAAHPGLVVEERVIRTTGDIRLDVPLSTPGTLDKGLFTKELEVALRRREVDAAVHSLKDLPTEFPPDLALGAILERENPADVLVSKTRDGIAGLGAGASVATSSLRRKCFLQWSRPDLVVAEIRGNVPTRIHKLRESDDLSAIVLAAAGLCRLQAAGCALALDGLEVTELPFMLPAPGQGAVAVECRADDKISQSTLRAIHHAATAASVNAERAILTGLGGGCHSPLGARAKTGAAGVLAIRAAWFAGEERRPREASVTGRVDDWVRLAAEAVEKLREPAR